MKNIFYIIKKKMKNYINKIINIHKIRKFNFKVFFKRTNLKWKINKLRDENDKYESQIFLIEQINNKKDYIIFYQKKLDEFKNNI